MVELVKDIILAVAALAGVGVAFSGLQTWRHQLKGRTEYDLARRLLRAVYDVRDEIGFLRSRRIGSEEIAAAAEEAALDPSDASNASDDAMAAVRARRWRQLQKALSNLGVEELEAEVLSGDEAKDATRPLHRCISELHRATMEYVTRPGDEPTDNRAERERLVQLRRTLHGSGDDDDKFAEDVRKAVAAIENYLRPHLKL